MTYLVLARKWRPRSFDTLVGQDHVVRALTHALDTQRLHHAWLFTGTRGVGKTTLSRILAKSLNCEKGITATPCDTCRACVEIDAGRFVDYVELDAASNRGVDEMTQLLEQAVYAPSSGRFKVYMIDEVHMLTGHAFNAMLKTLEEPPAHVKFILATTDPQKIPVTVLSRCLQFNLKQMAPESIVTHLQEILAQESVPFEAPALRLIAQAASGSMRDALSLTDQAIAYSAGNITVEAMQGMLGTIDQRYLVRLLQGLSAGNGAEVLRVADELATRGLSYSGALADLAILLSRVAIQQRLPGTLDAGEPLAEEIAGLAMLMHPDLVQLFYSVAVHSRNELSLAPDEYAGFVMACLRMLALAPQGGPADTVESEKESAPAQSTATADTAPPVQAQQASVTPQAPARSVAPGSSGSIETLEASDISGVVETSEAPNTPGASETPEAMNTSGAIEAPETRNTLGAAEAPEASHVVETAEEPAAPSSSGATELSEAPRVQAVPDTPKTPQAAVAVAPPAQREVHDDVPAWEDIPPDDDAGRFEIYDGMSPADDASYALSDDDGDGGFETVADDGAIAAAVAPGSEAAALLASERPKIRSPKLSKMDAKAWPALAAQLPATGLAAELARQSEWLGVQDDRIRLRVAVRTLAATAGKARLCTILSEHFGTVVQLEVEFGATGDETAHAVAQAERAARQQQAEHDAQEDPIVLALVAEFGAKLVPGSIRAI